MPNTRVQLTKENFRRMFHVLLPPSPELVARYATSSGGGGSNKSAKPCRYCKQGFDDTLRFLQSRYLISCTRCLGVASSYKIGKLPLQNQQHGNVAEEELPSNIVACVEFDQDCAECVQQRLDADTGTVPLSVVEVHERNLFQQIFNQIKTIKHIHCISFSAQF